MTESREANSPPGNPVAGASEPAHKQKAVIPAIEKATLFFMIHNPLSFKLLTKGLTKKAGKVAEEKSLETVSKRGMGVPPMSHGQDARATK
jgi:hypothetical protein